MFFRIRRASSTLNSWSSAPGILLQPRVKCRSGSSSVGEQDTLRLAVPLPPPLSRRQYSATSRKFTVPHKANFLALAPHHPFPTDQPGDFGRGGRVTKHQTTLMMMMCQQPSSELMYVTQLGSFMHAVNRQDRFHRRNNQICCTYLRKEPKHMDLGSDS